MKPFRRFYITSYVSPTKKERIIEGAVTASEKVIIEYRGGISIYNSLSDLTAANFNLDSDCIVFIDDEKKNPPEEFKELIRLLQEIVKDDNDYWKITAFMVKNLKWSIEEAKKIEEITKKISESYLETEEVRKIIKQQIDFVEENNTSENKNNHTDV